MSDSDDPIQSGTGAKADFDPSASRTVVSLPSTPAQREMWLSAQSGPEAVCAYNESFSIRLAGALDHEALVQAIQSLADYHEALRGHFSEDGEHFIIEPEVYPPIAHHDFSELSAGEHLPALERLQSQDASMPYDLTRGPLFRVTVIQLSRNQTVVILSANHAVCDGWSLDVLLTHLAGLYSAFVGGSPFPEPPRHGFSDYVRYCQTPEYKARIESSRAFWRKTFGTLPGSLSLPFDGYRPLLRSYGASHSEHTVSTELVEATRAFAHTHDVSFFSVLLSALATLLHRISQQTDLVIGVPVSGHPVAGMEDCVGHLVNLVPVRCRCDPTLTFAALCRATHAKLLDARENASVSFGQIVADLGVPREPSRVPLIGAILTYVKKYAPGKLVFSGCSVEYELNARRFETFELALNVIESDQGMQLKAHANSDLYSRGWLDWRLREYEVVLRDGCTAPAKNLGTLRLLPDDELRVIGDQFNRTSRPYPAHATVHQLFEVQVDRAPDRTAISFGKQKASYAELEVRANQLAHVLRGRGVARGMLVGLCMERSIDMVAAVLAVFKAGAGYLPLDPAFPPERLAFMKDDSDLALVVSERDLAGVHGCSRERTLELDTVREEIGRSSTSRVPDDERASQPENTAYALYTSGSTGRPKGVLIPHRAVVNFLTSMQVEPGLGPDDRLLAVASLSFDLSVLELLLPLIVGAQVVLASRDESVDGAALQRLIEDVNVTVMEATPTTWRLLIAGGWRGHPRFKALSGGEPLPVDLAEALLDRTGELWNMYGPTETTVYSTGGRVAEPRKGLPIGRPIANTTIWILDSQKQICPIGVWGEIYLGGAGVGLGYLNRPDLTREQFLPDPFTTMPQALLYKSGDIGRWCTNGMLECAGRNDFQVKLHGYRIELGEIEAILREHVSLAEAVVALRADQGTEPALVAYVVSKAGAAGIEADLRESLRTRLPFYMVPSRFVFLSKLPLTPNGKVDRKALPAPIRNYPSPVRERVAPRNETEAKLCQIWAVVLGKSGFGIDDNFFDIGGSSLLLIHVLSQARRQSLNIKLLTLLRHPTVRSLADHLSGDQDLAPRFAELRGRAERQREAWAEQKGRRKG